jgi:hypothetical protein
MSSMYVCHTNAFGFRLLQLLGHGSDMFTHSRTAGRHRAETPCAAAFSVRLLILLAAASTQS